MKTGESYKSGEMISYDCEENMRFADGVISKRILCLESGKWNETQLSCKGKAKRTCFSANIVWHLFIDFVSIQYYKNRCACDFRITN